MDSCNCYTTFKKSYIIHTLSNPIMGETKVGLPVLTSITQFQALVTSFTLFRVICVFYT